MRRICILLLLCLLLVQTVSAASTDSLVDEANLLSEKQEASLEAQLEDLGEKYQVDVVIVTTDTLHGKSPRVYADDYYDTHGYGDDGVLLLVSMEDNDWYISTCGYGITAFTDAGIEYIGEQITAYLSDGKYAAAFEEFIDQCDDFLNQAKTGEPYDTGNLPKGDFPLGGSILFAVVVGLVIAWIVIICLRRQLKSVRRQDTAGNYIRPGSLQLTGSGDLFLYHTVSRREKPQQSSGSSVHSSSSGRSHGGGGGKF
ncbi:MAG: TPM domain-containing protein [Oscillospiraceae bacterium]|nr:TPM domain-containing protein [Oscillospiraceae bacterium]